MQFARPLVAVPIALAFVFAAAAHADTVYNLNATLTNGDTVSGTITFQDVNIPIFVGTTIVSYQPGMEVDGDNFKIVDSSNNLVATFLNDYFIGSTLEQPYSEVFPNADFSQFFFLDIPGEIPLQGSPGGAICSDNAPCATYNATTNTSGSGAVSSLDQTVDVGSGSLTATPEPSSMLLLGSGLLGLALVAFRKSRSARHLNMQF